MTPADVFTKDYLEEHYLRLDKSARQLALENGYKSPSTVHRFLDIHGIPKKNGKPSSVLTRELLEDLYVTQQLSVKAIAKRLGLRSHTSVRTALKEFGIEIRPKGVSTPARENFYKKRRKGYQDISGAYWCSLRHGARIRKFEFNITPEYAWAIWLQQSGRCALSGAELRLVVCRQHLLDGRDEQTASLDRIDSRLGYVEGNVQWVHKDIQRMKSDMTDGHFIAWCVMVAQTRAVSK